MNISRIQVSSFIFAAIYSSSLTKMIFLERIHIIYARVQFRIEYSRTRHGHGEVSGHLISLADFSC